MTCRNDHEKNAYVHPMYSGTKNVLPVWMLNTLPSTLEYTGEFGLELLVFLPFVTWAAYAGLLSNRKVVTYQGMASFYKDLPIGDYQEKSDPRCYVEAKERPYYLPIKDEHSWDWQDRSPFHFWRDHRKLFAALNIPLPRSLEDKPLLIIHNKYNDEWGRGPVNYIPLSILDDLLHMLKNEFSIVYIRHGMSKPTADYAVDHNEFMNFGDEAVINDHEGIFLFDELYHSLSRRFSVNEFKNFLYSKCYYYFSTQGGGAHHCAMYSGSLIAINHVWGPEIHRSYGESFYSFLANPAPERLICLNPSQLVLAAQSILGSTVIDGRVHLKGSSCGVAESLSPQRQRDVYYAK